ncbi:MAG: hypothetical protein GY811_29595 [Myxococcales bacterium]|nr:hypothetical protein [Myxococcales bacterium]
MALAPSILIRLFNTHGRLIPFAHLGVKHLRRHYGDRWGNGSGGFGALGLSWMFAGGVSIRGGIGFHGMAAVEARSERVSVQQPAHGSFFFETGIRYWF